MSDSDCLAVLILAFFLFALFLFIVVFVPIALIYWVLGYFGVSESIRLLVVGVLSAILIVSAIKGDIEVSVRC